MSRHHIFLLTPTVQNYDLVRPRLSIVNEPVIHLRQICDVELAGHIFGQRVSAHRSARSNHWLCRLHFIAASFFAQLIVITDIIIS